VLAVLVVSLVLLSTQLYILEVGRSLDGIQLTRVGDFVLALKLGSKHVITGSLANISVGGEGSTLYANLERWAAFTGDFYQAGQPVLTFALENRSPYTNGTRVSWGTDGFGVSSACVDINFSLSGREVNVQSSYAVNVTTSLVQIGTYRTLQGDVKQINVTCNVFNEGKAALAESVTVLYDYYGVWRRADAESVYSFVDYGNGTYLVSFEVDMAGENVVVSTQVHDLREIYVEATSTCTPAE